MQRKINLDSEKLIWVCLGMMMIIQSTLCAREAFILSPVNAEVGHLPAGLSHWSFGRFDLYKVNPPLVRLAAALPLLIINHKSDWTNYSTDLSSRNETAVGQDFTKINHTNTFFLYSVGRLACLPFVSLGALGCFFWARKLYGSASGLSAAALWCFCPNMIGNGALMMPDVPVTSLIIFFSFFFWMWLEKPSLVMASISGLLLGLCDLTKFTSLLLYPFAIVWFFVYLYKTHQRFIMVIEFLLIIIISLFLINFCYLFPSLIPITSFNFDSQIFKSIQSFVSSHENLLPSKLVIPLPADFLKGIDIQAHDFERGLPSFLDGQWKLRGWWYFYILGFFYKSPTCIIILMMLCFCQFRTTRRLDSKEVFLFTMFLWFFCSISSQTGFSIHFRYILPCYPFVFIFVSKLYSAHQQRHSRKLLTKKFAANTLILLSVAESFTCYPYSLSFFNFIAGGPSSGYLHMLDSSVSWGQDLQFVQNWVRVHKKGRQVYFAPFTTIAPEALDFSYEPPPLGLTLHVNSNEKALRSDILLNPGIYIVDVNYLQGSEFGFPGGDGNVIGPRRDGNGLGYFNCVKPLTSIGYSFKVFVVKPSDRMRLTRR